MKRVIAALMLAWLGSGAALAQATAPYAGQHRQPIKALTPSEIDDLLAGRGMGLAKAAELNSFPGPAHALDLADALGLSAGQRAAIGEIRARMSEQAMALGRRLIGLEADLDRSFAEAAIDTATLEAKLQDIAQVQARLRGVHLRAHLETRRVMNPAQIAQYNQARGYGDGQDGADKSKPGVHGPGGGHGGGHKH